ncbi:hypothetical protein [Gallaecimonas xiamenensis]|uniref:Uncharacterized protein n=1 Tax=Gallaecimonas xiamenensis 3-C-1 TaxID=745411 RepID=K2JRB0_9GAMM|nr:hypothetical protein [Gallaecimonas xiamenensis]EKE77057.1 hypothetical protein B3C1_02590 [Gallaecimonas xiamenensis 3-C-1]
MSKEDVYRVLNKGLHARCAEHWQDEDAAYLLLQEDAGATERALAGELGGSFGLVSDPGPGWCKIDQGQALICCQGRVFGNAQEEGDLSIRRQGQSLLLQWNSVALPSPFPDGARQCRLGHGQFLPYPARGLLGFWCKAHYQGAGDQAAMDALSALKGLPDNALRAACLRYLGMKDMSLRWVRDFTYKAAFIQCRNGKVPKIRTLNVTREAIGIQLALEVVVWDMFSQSWMPDRGRADLTLMVEGIELVKLYDFASDFTALAFAPYLMAVEPADQI